MISLKRQCMMGKDSRESEGNSDSGRSNTVILQLRSEWQKTSRIDSPSLGVDVNKLKGSGNATQWYA